MQCFDQLPELFEQNILEMAALCLPDFCRFLTKRISKVEDGCTRTNGVDQLKGLLLLVPEEPVGEDAGPVQVHQAHRHQQRVPVELWYAAWRQSAFKGTVA